LACGDLRTFDVHYFMAGGKRRFSRNVPVLCR
jgi:hypothetical protein